MTTPHLPFTAPAYGGDWNPEQWDDATIAADIDLMREAGVTLISLGIFSWAKLEPREGHYELDWLGALLDHLHDAGISVDLATGTASPPAWMAAAHPDTLPVDANGVRLGFGSRQQYSPSSHVFREAALALVDRVASRFASHPAVVMWHVSNEYGCHVAESFDEESAAAFRQWLRERYETCEALNRAWGTAFWSQTYSDWNQIQPPRAMPTCHNPAQMLDWKRFNDHQLRSLMTAEIAVIRRYSTLPISTNFMGTFPALDYRAWAEHVDVVSNDCYPDPADPAAAHQIAWEDDVMRGLKAGAPWILMEQAPSAVQWRRRNCVKRPGQYALWSASHLAHGADAILQFQWRQSIQGAETFHSGMVPHAEDASRTWREVRDLGDALSQMGTLVGTRVRSEVAIVIDWESAWARACAIGPTDDGEGESHMALAQAWHRTLWEAGIPVDVVGSDADFSAYRLVICPELFIDNPPLSAALEEVARAGAQVLVCGPNAVVDEQMCAIRGGYNGSWRTWLGVRVAGHAPLVGNASTAAPTPLSTSTQNPEGGSLGAYAPTPGEPGNAPSASRNIVGNPQLPGRSAMVSRISRAVGTPAAATWVGVRAETPALERVLAHMGTPSPDLRGGMWAEELCPAAGLPACPGALHPQWGDVEIIASFDGRGGGVDLAGMPALTRRPLGRGAGWYLATDLDEVSRDAVLRLVAAYARVRPLVADLPDGVEACRREHVLFLLNHGDRAVEIPGILGKDLVGGGECTGHVVIAPRSALIVDQREVPHA